MTYIHPTLEEFLARVLETARETAKLKHSKAPCSEGFALTVMGVPTLLSYSWSPNMRREPAYNYAC